MNKSSASQIRYHIVSSIIIYLIGAPIEMLLSGCSSCFQSPYFLSDQFILRHSYSGISWVAFWKGSEFLVDFWDKKLPWLVAPGKRFFFSVLSIIIYVFIAIWAIDIFFDLVILNRSFEKAIEESGAPFLSVTIFTLAMNVFMHGRGFLMSWRQTAVDNERLKTEQVATQYNSLKNQVNPHFLFNSFNALSSLVYEDQAKAVEFIRKLSQVYRYVLDSKDEELVSVEKEMDFVRNFAFLQQIRFGENLTISTEGRAAGRKVPPLAIQLLVENAIKHNVVSEKDPLHVSISFENDHCLVKNTLKGKKSKDSTGIGLNNLVERYKYLTDRPLKINKTDSYFEVQLPLLTLDA